MELMDKDKNKNIMIIATYLGVLHNMGLNFGTIMFSYGECIKCFRGEQ